MHFEWAYLQSFAAVIEHGSLSGAARALGLGQATLSRHVSALEHRIGARLFWRTNSGVELTSEGSKLLPYAKEMANAAAKLELSAGANETAFTGTVRVTASDIVATYLLPPLFKDLKDQDPDLTIELVASDETENLLRRDADIAIRMYRPTQLDVVTKKLCELEIAMFAAPSYLREFGAPVTKDDLKNHRVIGYDQSPLLIEGLRRAGVTVDRDFFAFRCDDQAVCWEMIKTGMGLGFVPICIGKQTSGVEQISVPQRLATVPVWLTAHKEVKETPRIRWVYDFLASRISALA